MKLSLILLLALVGCQHQAEKPAEHPDEPVRLRVRSYLQGGDSAALELVHWEPVRPWRQRDEDQVRARWLADHLRAKTDFWNRNRSALAKLRVASLDADAVQQQQIYQVNARFTELDLQARTASREAHKRAEQLRRSTDTTRVGQAVTLLYRFRRKGKVRLDSTTFRVFFKLPHDQVFGWGQVDHTEVLRAVQSVTEQAPPGN
jgi:hypothetical protein